MTQPFPSRLLTKFLWLILYFIEIQYLGNVNETEQLVYSVSAHPLIKESNKSKEKSPNLTIIVVFSNDIYKAFSSIHTHLPTHPVDTQAGANSISQMKKHRS